MKTVFFTGAGISAESNIPTYRGVNGVYNHSDVGEWLTGTTYEADPNKIHGYLDSVLEMNNNAEPNAAHIAIANFANKYPETVVFTQNVDTLFEKAGYPCPIHVHGTINEFMCRRGCTVPVAANERPSDLCEFCKSELRYNVVLFEEEAPEYATLNAVLKSLHRGDNLVVVGTSGVVLPVNRMVRKLNFKGVRSWLNNLEMSHDVTDGLFYRSLRGPATEMVPKIIEQIEGLM